MKNIRIVLVETAGALNLGSVARVMQNMGLSELWLVNPRCDRFSDDAQIMAVRAKSILAQAKIVDRLSDALVGCQRAIATAGRITTTSSKGEQAGFSPETLPISDPRLGMTWLMEVDRSAIVFGAEDRGLSNAELQYCQRAIRIPVSEDYPSLNLAQAVAICCYEVRLAYEARQNPTFLGNSHVNQLSFQEGSLRESTRSPKISTSQMAEDLVQSPTIDESQTIAASKIPDLSAPLDQVEAFYVQLEAVLLKIGYLYPHTAFRRMQKLRQLFNRAHLTSSEVSMLRGIIRQINWAILDRFSDR
ncbi:RNA methyltransferase [Tumidithrix elongata RA019]|uniref:tRNA (cytidine/uridine-2'-O-)-methyltransferase TrmJ n=1 Tax=Tumidithrix elongata BACA0141 TaxID=2716417 RepID=A0AAW9Q5L2_9CYAN|nr:RNA methyltransferase [Tumidithrix elongata RA019]